MSNQAKDAYHTYHVAMGNLDAPAFEHLSMWEQDAWAAVAGATQWQQERIENLSAELRQAENRGQDLEFLKEKLQDERDELRTELATAKIALRARRRNELKA